MKVDFVDLKRQHKKIEPEIEKAFKSALKRGDFILGQEVKLFENEFARYCGSKFGIGLNSGTDALFLSLLAMGIGPGDEVIVPPFTFIATANCVSYTGAKPVFADIDPATYNIDCSKIEKAITSRTKAVIPVHLFGQCADMDPIMRIAGRHGLKVIEDACQAHGALYKSHVTSHTSQVKKVGSIGDVGCFSFYPTKNLGGFGDGGMVVTNDEKIYRKLLLLRDCGRGPKDRYEHLVVGYNSRLDTIQAAGLRVKLKYLDLWNKMRKYNAGLYDKLLEGSENIIRPFSADYSEHVYHVYAVRLKNRDEVQAGLKAGNVATAINYSIPLHLQKAHKGLGYRPGDFPAAEKVCREIISLPMHPMLSRKEIEYTVKVLKKTAEA